MRTLASDKVETYTGAQLRSGWLEETFSLEPDAIAAFRGPCDVAPEHMIDLDDLRAGSTIVARDMLHFIVEHADGDLSRAVLRQRLLLCCASETLSETHGIVGLSRDGDDLYVVDAESKDRRKLSVSIATNSRAGTTLIHLGINVDPSGAPVPAVGLTEVGVEPDAFAREVLARYSSEMASAAHAATKVREAP